MFELRCPSCGGPGVAKAEGGTAMKALLQDQIRGLTERLRVLQSQRDVFLKAQGLDEQKEKANLEVVQLKKQVEDEKDALNKLIEKKNRAMMTTIDQMTAKMDALLPRGKAAMKITESGEVLIAWQNEDGVYVPYNGLSGGEKVAFDGALVAALGANVLIIEGAEEDPERLACSLDQYAATDKQIIVNSAHDPARIPQEWGVVRL
jgi:chromosome segregation ATPase